ncbi:integrator complex subunit 10 [Neocloeon triangulifer]|uniref:integrator complex subunit 10 n=1 Tax=Neocloeon triangulifer TaxID=2078957 RepID=UPI00286F3822|nr:integrator complex subunit 10 [Neocloeon triangulifer]
MVAMEVELSDEEYLVNRAKEELKRDSHAARAWMLTAKSLFPNNFSVQFEVYNIEKALKHVKEAALCFSTLFQQFGQEPLIWQEVQALTKPNNNDPEASFLQDMFSHIPQEVQQSVLVATADRTEDKMEQCRILLLLLKKFPHTAPHHAPKLVELLLDAEKREKPGFINSYQKFLVVQVLPIIGENSSIMLSQMLVFKLLHKAIDLYCTLLLHPSREHNLTDEEREVAGSIADPWEGLFSVQESLGHKLGWNLSTPSPMGSNKEIYFQKLRHFAQSRSLDANQIKELVYCSTTFLLLCLYEYSTYLSTTIGSNGSSQEASLLLVEAFLGETYDVGPSSAKRPRVRSTEEELHGLPTLTVSSSGSNNAKQSLVQIFWLAVKTWDMLNSAETFKKEFVKLKLQLRLAEGPWLYTFLQDKAMLQGQPFPNEEFAVAPPIVALPNLLRLASTAFIRGHFVKASEFVMNAVSCLPASPIGQLSFGLRTAAPSGRHLHYLALSRVEVLQYCTKLLTSCLQQIIQSPSGEAALGHCLVLLQLDWPQEQELASYLLKQVTQMRRFSYPLFTRYIINVDLLEEFTYLASEQGGSVVLDILPTATTQLTRRMATRGVDKGAKEDFRQAMRRQVARSSENIQGLVQQFLFNEKNAILQSISGSFL